MPTEGPLPSRVTECYVPFAAAQAFPSNVVIAAAIRSLTALNRWCPGWPGLPTGSRHSKKVIPAALLLSLPHVRLTEAETIPPSSVTRSDETSGVLWSFVIVSGGGDGISGHS